MNTQTGKNTAEPVVAVFGATGHTGRFVVAELLRRGMTPIAIARNVKALSAAHFPENEVYRRQATIDDAASLDRALHEAQAVITARGLLSIRPTLSRVQLCGPGFTISISPPSR
jgi:uncharacterized protein YbjT (DUF2867 family)